MTFDIRKTSLYLAFIGGVIGGLPMAQAQYFCDTDCASSTVPYGQTVALQAADGATTTFTVDTYFNQKPVTGVGLGQHTVETFLFGQGQGALVVDVAHAYFGGIDFSANSGGVTFNTLGRGPNQDDGTGWAFSGTGHRFSSGDDVLHNHAGSIIFSSTPTRFTDVGETPRDQTELLVNAIDFGTGDDLFRNEGALVLGEARFELLVADGSGLPARSESDERAFETRFDNLETFENSGRIVMGAWVHANSRRVVPEMADWYCTLPSLIPGLGGLETCGNYYGDTDRSINDVLVMHGTHFIGLPGSTIILDADLGGGRPQHNCQQRGDSGTRFSLPAADCIDLRWGSTEGVTEVVLRDLYPDDLGAHYADGITIIDVREGSSAAGHFVLSPLSDGYEPVSGAANKGLMMYALLYDEAASQHKLVSLPGTRAFRFSRLTHTAQALSRHAGGHWFDRRHEQREGDEQGATWLRLGQLSASHGGKQQVSALGYSLAVSNDYDMDATTLTIGRDFYVGNDWVLGGSIAYVHADLDFDTFNGTAGFDGAALGAHAGYTRGAMYFDSQLLMSWLEMDYRDPQLADVADRFRAVSSRSQSLDLRTELGWRLALGEGLNVEPLIGLSWVRTEFGEMDVHPKGDQASRPHNHVYGGDATSSLRAAVGARLLFDSSLGDLRLGYTVTARYWEELQGEAKVRIRNAGADMMVHDTFDSGLTELTAGLALSNASGRISGLLQATGMFGDYESLGLTAGFRYQW